MKAERNVQILTAGLEAAHERMFSDSSARRPEYPRDLGRLYSNMEDEVFALFESVQDKKYALAVSNAADVIVTASEMIEYAKLLERVADEPWDTEA